jgi:general secretion pathway protein K
MPIFAASRSAWRRGAARTSRGFALLIVLWAMVLAALIGSELTALGRRETKIAANLRAAATVEAAADGAVNEAIFRLLRNEQGWSADGKPHRLAIGQVAVDVAIRDERGKIDLNGAPAPLLAALLAALGLGNSAAQDLAAAIVAWHGGAPMNVTEIVAWQARYRAAGLGYEPPFKPFETVDELALVLGVTPDLFARLEPHVTVFGAGGVDPNAADPIVLAALRAVAGSAAPPVLAAGGGSVVTIDAYASGPDRGAFVRRALVRLGGADGYSIYGWRRAPATP